jgi:hypothetical protein
MRLTQRIRKRLAWGGVVLALLVFFFFFYVDDWSRDFMNNYAVISEFSADPELRPLISDRTSAELVEALTGGARRIRNWEYAGEASDGDSTLVMFVRTSRLFRFKDDITMRIEDQGRERVVTGESRSRVGKGDLGQNPRNLRRLMTELRAVLDGAVRQEPQR